MKLPTLEEFLANTTLRNRYVRETGFESLYVRKSRRVFRGSVLPFLDIAAVSVRPRKRGQGLFTALLARIQAEHPEMNIYVESVLNPRLPAKLLSLGFEPSDADPSSFVRLSKKVCEAAE